MSMEQKEEEKEEILRQIFKFAFKVFGLLYTKNRVDLYYRLHNVSFLICIYFCYTPFLQDQNEEFTSVRTRFDRLQ